MPFIPIDMKILDSIKSVHFIVEIFVNFHSFRLKVQVPEALNDTFMGG